MTIVSLAVPGRRCRTHRRTYSSTPGSKAAAPPRRTRQPRTLTFANHPLKGPDQYDHCYVNIRPLPHTVQINRDCQYMPREIYKNLCVVSWLCVVLWSIAHAHKVRTPPTTGIRRYTSWWHLLFTACSVRGASNGQDRGCFPESTAVLERAS